MPIIPIRLYNITSPHLTLFYVEHATMPDTSKHGKHKI